MFKLKLVSLLAIGVLGFSQDIKFGGGLKIEFGDHMHKVPSGSMHKIPSDTMHKVPCHPHMQVNRLVSECNSNVRQFKYALYNYLVSTGGIYYSQGQNAYALACSLENEMGQASALSNPYNFKRALAQAVRTAKSLNRYSDEVDCYTLNQKWENVQESLSELADFLDMPSINW